MCSPPPPPLTQPSSFESFHALPPLIATTTTTTTTPPVVASQPPSLSLPPSTTTTTTSVASTLTSNATSASAFKVGRKLPDTSDLPIFTGDTPGVTEGPSVGVFLRRIDQESAGPHWDDTLRIILARKQLRGSAKDR